MKTLSTIFSCLLLSALCHGALASPLNITGTWLHVEGSDALGLNGTAFDYRVNPGAPVNLHTFSSGSELTTLELGPRHLAVDTASIAGLFDMTQDRQHSTVFDAATIDRLTIGGSMFEVGGYRLELPSISFTFDGGLITTPGADPQPVFTAADVNHYQLGSFAGLYGIQLWTDTHRIARYAVTGFGVASLPVPGSIWLISVALIMLVGARQSSKH